MKTGDGTARVEFDVRFTRVAKGRRKIRPKPEPSEAPHLRPVPGQVPRITRLLVLGHHFERLVKNGEVKDYAEIARLTGLSRARVTQLVNLTLLAPRIQGRIFEGNEQADAHVPLERDLRSLADVSSWSLQEESFPSP